MQIGAQRRFSSSISPVEQFQKETCWKEKLGRGRFGREMGKGKTQTSLRSALTRKYTLHIVTNIKMNRTKKGMSMKMNPNCLLAKTRQLSDCRKHKDEQEKGQKVECGCLREENRRAYVLLKRFVQDWRSPGHKDDYCGNECRDVQKDLSCMIDTCCSPPSAILEEQYEQLFI
jgi:hypothetical protein